MVIRTMGALRLTLGSACLLAGCAAADDLTGGGGPARDSGTTFVVDTGTPSSVDAGTTFVVDTGTPSSVDAGRDTAVAGEDTSTVAPVDTGVPEGDTAPSPIDTSVFLDTAIADTGLAYDAPGGCGTNVVGAAEGTSCASPYAISMDVACTRAFTGDTCAGTPASVSTSCGAGQGKIHAIQLTSGIKLYSIVVSSGFQLATIPGPPLCGGAGSCVGTGMSTGVSAGSTQWWVVMKTGGGCGPYTLTITPS